MFFTIISYLKIIVYSNLVKGSLFSNICLDVLPLVYRIIPAKFVEMKMLDLKNIIIRIK